MHMARDCEPVLPPINDKNSLFGFGHRDPKNSGGDRVPASIGTPTQLACEADSPRKPISAETVLDKGFYVNRGAASRQTSLPDEAGMDIFLTLGKVFKLTGCPSILLPSGLSLKVEDGTVSLSNRRRGQ